MTQANALLHGQETSAHGDAHKRSGARQDITWHISMRPGKRRMLDKKNEIDALIDTVEKLKASVRAKVEHPFLVIKRQFGHVKVRYRGLAKNTAQLHTLFALRNLWMARKANIARCPGMSAPVARASARNLPVEGAARSESDRQIGKNGAPISYRAQFHAPRLSRHWLCRPSLGLKSRWV